MVIKKSMKIIARIAIYLLLLYLILMALYIRVLPALVSNKTVINQVEKYFHKTLGVELEIINPELKTNFNPVIGFKIEKIKLNKGDDKLLFAQNFDTVISFEKLLSKEIVVRKFGADNLLVDFTKLSELFPAQTEKKEQKPSEWNVDLFDSILYLKNSFIVYKINPDTTIKINAKKLGVNNNLKVERFVHFDINIDIVKNNKTVNIAIADENKVIIKDKHLYINNCNLNINKSKMFINAYAGKKDFEILLYAKRFFIPDVIKLLQTNVVENNINDILVYFDGLNGDFDFGLKFNKKGMGGEVKVNRVSTKLVPLANLPANLTNGLIKLDEKTITLTDFKGYYDNNKSNTFSFTGTVDDYLKSIDTKIDMNAKLTNDFTEKYLSKLVGIPITLVGNANSKIVVNSIYNKIDVMLAGKIAKGDDILVDGASLSPTGYDRAVKADIHCEGNLVNIKDINYYIAADINKNSKLKPILTLKGNFDIAKNKLLDIGFEIPNPLPSEFLNVLIGQRMFRKGQFHGNMHYYDNNGKFPTLSGNLEADKILIPSQRMFLKKGSISTNNGTVNITANGKYRRTGYDFSGKINNAIKFPVVIKDINLTLDDVDIDRILATMNTPVDEAQKEQNIETIQSEEDIAKDDSAAPTFDFSNLIIENSVLHVVKGKYKDINFSNVKAKMTLDKNSLLKVFSNRFEIAEGHTSANINCDLKKHKYSIVLGIKDVNSDIMSTSILNLKREISGKASGLISLNTDESLKLNGSIKFIVKDGTIQKVGLVEYILKFASIFRNPVAMISPAIFSDMVNIPEGNFDKITGELYLKDNVIEMMKIKSYASQLSAFIVGRYELESGDAALRIYTKFSNQGKGFAGALRNISLNSLANRIPLNSRNDSNYYAAELSQLPPIDADEKDCQVFLTKVDGDVQRNNFISSLKKIK